MYEILNLQEEGSDNPPIEQTIPPTHLDSPISTKVQQLATGLIPPHRSKRGARRLSEELDRLLQASGLTDPPTCWDCTGVLPVLLSSEPNYQGSSGDERMKSFVIASLYNTALQAQTFLPDEALPKDLSFDDFPTNHRSTLILKSRIKDLWEGVVRLTALKSNKDADLALFSFFNEVQPGIFAVDLSNGIQLVFSSSLLIMKTMGSDILLNRDQILEISDLASQRFILHLATTFATYLNQDQYLTPEELEEILSWGDQCILNQSSEIYQLVYKWEALCISVLLSQDSSPVGTFQDDLIASIKDIHESGEDRARQAITLLEKLYRRSPHKVAQAYGLYRIWGHPVINPVKGVIALQETAKQYRHGDTQTIQQVDGKFAEIFVKRYWKKHGQWPNISTEELGFYHPLSVAHREGRAPPTLPRNMLSHWGLIEFKQTFPIDPKLDILEMLSDKAMSLGKDDLIEVIQTTYSIGFSEARSVIVQWLKSNLSDPEEFLRTIDRLGFPPQEVVVGVCPKEREGKVKARLFGLLTLYKRMYVVLTEALISEHILPYFHEVTMTDDSTSLTKKQIKFTKDSKRGGTQNTSFARYSSLDFTKWNSNMREQDTKGVFKMLDNLFGLTNCISRTYQMFEGSHIYLADSYFLPPSVDHEFLEVPEIWTGHLGGIEGLRQKGWTVWTVCLLLLVAEHITGKLEIMGQGDNQIIKISYPKHLTSQQINEHHLSFLQRLDRTLNLVGPPLKLEETWTSSGTYVYGKFIIHNGFPLSMSLKKIARLFHLSNDLFPTIESSLSSLAANCIAACSSDLSPLVPFFIYGVETLGAIYFNMRSCYLHNEPLLDIIEQKQMTYTIPKHTGSPDSFAEKEVIRPSPQQIRTILNSVISFDGKFQLRILLSPRCLGGFSVLQLPNLLLRKFPDPTVLAVASLKAIYSTAKREDVRKAIRDILSPRLATTRNYELLLENPTALNLATPSSPAESKRNIILQYFQAESNDPNTWIKNRGFLHFLKDMGLNQDSLAQYLLSLRPCFPRVISEVWAATPLARARHAIGKVGKANTLVRKAAAKGYGILSRLRQAEINSVISTLYMLYIPSRTQSWSSDYCSVFWVDHLRGRSWGTKLEGLSAVPPFECFQLEPLRYPEECNLSHYRQVSDGHIKVRVDPSLSQDEIHSSQQVGGYPPYLGSSTREGTGGLGKELAKHCPSVVSKPLGLTKLIGWATNRDSQLTKVIRRLVQIVTDLDPEGLEPDETQIIGTVHHRISDTRTDHGGGLSLLYTHLSKIQFHTASLTDYSKGSSNTNLMFQSVLIYFGSLLSSLFANPASEVAPSYHIHMKSKCCIQPVNDGMIDGPPFELEALLREPSEKNAFNWCPESKIHRFQERLVWDNSLLSLSDNPDAQDFASVVAEYSMKLIRRQYLREPGGGVMEAGKLPFNWAIRVDPILLLHTLCVRLVSMFIACEGINMHHREDMIKRIPKFFQALGNDGFSHLDSLLNIPNLLDFLVYSGLTDKGIPDPSLPRGPVGYYFKSICCHLIISLLSGAMILSDVSCVSLPTCPLDQAPILLLITKHLLVESNTNCTSWLACYTYLKHQLMEVRNKDLPRSMVIKIQLREALFTSFPIEMASNKLTSLLQDRAGFHNVHVDSYCKLFSLTELPYAPVSKTNQKEVKQFKTSLRKIPLGSSTGLQFKFPPGSRMISVSNILGEREEYCLSLKDHTGWSLKTSTLPSSSSFKLIGILRDHISVVPESVATVATLADGAGGFAYSFGHMDTQCNIIYNTLKVPVDDIEQNPLQSYIPALVNRPDIKKRTLCLTLLEEGISNLLDSRFETQLQRSYQGIINIITCDAEAVSSSRYTRLYLVNNIVRLGIIFKATLVIIKFYYDDLELLSQAMRVIGVGYLSIKVVRSHLSSSTNTEIYLLATNRREDVCLSSLRSSVHEINMLDTDFNEVLNFCKSFREIIRSGATAPSEEHLTSVCVEIASTLESTVKFEKSTSIAPLIKVLLMLGTPANWQLNLMNWISMFLKKPEQKLLSRRSDNQQIRCSTKDLSFIITTWLIVWSAYADIHPFLIQKVLDTGFLCLYTTPSGSYGSTIIEGDTHDGHLLRGRGDRLIRIKSLLHVLKTTYIFQEIGRLKSELSQCSDWPYTNIKYPNKQFDLPAKWWPSSFLTAFSLIKNQEEREAFMLWAKSHSLVKMHPEFGTIFLGYQKEILFTRYLKDHNFKKLERHYKDCEQFDEFQEHQRTIH